MSIASAAPMSSRTPRASGGPAAAPRVRDQARAAAALMAFSVATSIGVAAVFLVVATLVRQA